MRAARAALLLTALLGAWNLWGYDLWAPDEPYFAEGAREMVVDGHWAVPHVNGQVTTDKPPLFFWLIALLSLPFGHVSSLSARLPSTLAAVGSVALTIRLGRRLAGEATGALAGLVLATTYLPWDKSRTAQIDALLCFLILSALSAFEAFRSGSAAPRRAGLLFWLATALAVLAKGPVGLLLPLGIALVTLASDRSLRSWRRFAPLSGPLLFLVVVGAWAASVSLWHGDEYSIWGALREHALERGLHGMHHVQPPWYYLEVLPLQLVPWSGLVPGALLLAWRRRRAAGDRFLLVFVLFVVVFFSISTEKRDLYVLPAYPGFAVLMARLVTAISGEDRRLPPAPREVVPHARWVTVPQGILGLTMVGAGISFPFAARTMAPAAFGPSVVLGVVVVVGGVAVAVAAGLGRPRPSVLRTAGAISAAYLVAATWLFPALNPVKSARPLAREMTEATASSRAAGETVVAYRLGNLPEALSFYSDGVYLREVSSFPDLVSHLSRDARVYALADAADLARLPDGLHRSLEVVYSAEMSRMKVVLVANQARPADSGR